MKKLPLRFSLITIMVFAQLIFSAKENRAQNIAPKYECVMRNGVPVTLVTTERGVIELIKWKSTFFSNSSWTPERRCQAVTERFQVHSDSGTLRYITYGESNAQTVICVSDKNNQREQTYQCKQDGITVANQFYDSTLITLEPQDNPAKVLQDLFNISARVNYGGITRGVGSSNINVYPDFVDLEKVLREKPVLEPVLEPILFEPVLEN